MWRVSLSLSDRAAIGTGTKAGLSFHQIAWYLGRCPSVISRQIRRNTTRTWGVRS
ncbi:helix-turn-helix domain-containing protein [Schaalia sp. 19OD2882]|uniref:helix-turn-helix domain-containing protein n=1 Tax=Schaalia sp. 19OD2882 TaxID=2794089 RepID=UPI001C1F071B|nr:helix-turn-helix domain-containing protein [Schaalia sp. 19OD2882]